MKKTLILSICHTIIYTLISCNPNVNHKESDDLADSVVVEDVNRFRAFDNAGNSYFASYNDDDILFLYDEDGNMVEPDEEDDNRSFFVIGRNGVTYNAHVNSSGHTNIYDTDGNYYNFYTDDFGNTTINTY